MWKLYRAPKLDFEDDVDSQPGTLTILVQNSIAPSSSNLPGRQDPCPIGSYRIPINVYLKLASR